MIELLYRGFDGLDLSFQAQISVAFCELLQDAKEKAQQARSTAMIEWGGVLLEVFESGAKGGYAFMASTGEFGSTWFFKKPNARDPWGVRVSCNSFFLATNGLGEARSQIYRVLAAFGIAPNLGEESIGRVDYALDFLMPDFQLIPELFVMHSNANRSDHLEHPEMTINGRSGRVTSVTVGKMPGRQAIVYDKRAEIIAKRKVGWWEIWDANRMRMGQPILQRDAPSECSIWRVELRAGKRLLKDQWNIRTWTDLDARLGDLVTATLDAIRYTTPTMDSNRSRWPESELWSCVRQEVNQDLFEMASFVDPNLVKRVQADAHSRLLLSQIIGSVTTRAAICGISAIKLAEYAAATGNEIAAAIQGSPAHFERKLDGARKRYDVRW